MEISGYSDYEVSDYIINQGITTRILKYYFLEYFLGCLVLERYQILDDFLQRNSTLKRR